MSKLSLLNRQDCLAHIDHFSPVYSALIVVMGYTPHCIPPCHNVQTVMFKTRPTVAFFTAVNHRSRSPRKIKFSSVCSVGHNCTPCLVAFIPHHLLQSVVVINFVRHLQEVSALNTALCDLEKKNQDSTL